MAARVKTGFIGFILLFFLCANAQAQLAPAPRKAPRTPVGSQSLTGSKVPMPASRSLSGEALVLDAERLRLQGYDVRLYGIVPPQASASFGPQARATIDALVRQGAVSCLIKDRSRTGDFLASCRSAGGQDFGLELLRRGLAVSARGTLQSSDVAEIYLAAEQAAQESRLGLWSISPPLAASDKALREAAAKTAAAKAELVRLREEEAKAKREAQALADAAATEPAMEQNLTGDNDLDRLYGTDVVPAPVSVITTGAEQIPQTTVEPPVVTGIEPSPVLAASLSSEDVAALVDELKEAAIAMDPNRGVFERYQLLLASALLVLAACFGGIAFLIHRFFQKRDDLRSIAAALRGELMAARSICQARLAKIAQSGERDVSWPRLRSLVFQAYVGRLGLLGATLSRQIASIYGLASDYASYYNTGDERSEGASKRQAIESLVRHIEEVTPHLSVIERDGCLEPKKAHLWSSLKLPLRLAAQARPLSLQTAPIAAPPPDNGGRPNVAPSADQTRPDEKVISPAMGARLSDVKDELMAATAKARNGTAKKTAMRHGHVATPRPKPKETPPLTQTRNAAPRVGAAAEAAAAPVPLAERAILKTPVKTSAQPATPSQKEDERKLPSPDTIKTRAGIDFKAPLMKKLARLKMVGLATPKPELADDDPYGLSIPDYANLTEEELEALLYAEDEMATATASRRRTG